MPWHGGKEQCISVNGRQVVCKESCTCNSVTMLTVIESSCNKCKFHVAADVFGILAIKLNCKAYVSI